MSKVRLNILIVFCVFMMVHTGPAVARTIYVDPNGSADFNSIQVAIDDANNGDEIEVAPGTYYEAINFNGKAVRLYSSGGPDVTVIDGTGHYNVAQCRSGEGSDTVLEGFTIAGGNANGASWPDFTGGGMYCENSGPMVTNCCFTGNTAGYGAGIYNNNSSPIVNNCSFTNNNATNYGGGMNNYNGSSPTVTDCNFSGNTAGGYGGGMCNEQSTDPNIADCIFNGNTAGISGGGMFNNDSSPTVVGCDFYGNQTINNDGGGMCNVESSPGVVNCTFNGNSAARHGGGMYDYINCGPTISNCAFINNTAQWGSGLCNYYNSNPTVTNCTFSENIANNGGGMYNYDNSNPTVTNCILWGDTPDEIYDDATSSATVTYSDVQGGWGGAGGNNIFSNPVFLDPANGDLSLGSCSPCVDAGSNSAVPAGVTTDLGGNPRFVDDTGVPDTGSGAAPIVDMGAYERQSDSVPLGTISVPGDFNSIQKAISEAYPGDQIVVAPGTYYEAINFNGKAVRLYSSGGPDVTIIDANGIAGAYHVVQCVSDEDANTILEGFTITGGNANGPATNDRYGGGMYNDQSSPTITNCTFLGNSTERDGGGMYNDQSSPTVTDCIFSDNSAVSDSSDGGGMSNSWGNPTVNNCIFNHNTAYFGGGGMNNSGGNPTVTNCTFSGNSAKSQGGGMSNWGGNPTVTNCTFSGNSSEREGGGMYNIDNSPMVTNCIFSGNTSFYTGGGMYNYYSNLTVTNCNFIGNSTGSYGGGGIYNVNSSPMVTNCNFIGNSADRYGGGIYNRRQSSPIVTNCILWGDSPVEIYNDESTPTITYCDVHGGWPGAGNINISPLFVDAGAGDFRLNWYSACVDAGDNNAPGLPATDLAGNPRVMDGDGDGNSVVDMGIYELETGMIKVAVGTLEVTIEPNAAIDASAKWKVESGEQWYNSGEVVSLPPGYYKLDFNELPDWYEPETLLVGYDTVDSNYVPQQTLWVRVIGDMNAGTIAEYKPLPAFDIGQIPPRDAPHGRTLEFHIDANWLGDDVSYSFTTTFDPNYPEPEGPILIDPVSGLFTYEPNDANDRAAFIVTFRAESSIDVNEQSVRITPIPDLPLEYEILSRPVPDELPLPDPCDRDYIFVNEILSDSNEFLNGGYRQVRSVTVAGIEITIEDVCDNPVYVYNSDLDINDLTIFAETLTIRDRLHLPQTAVTIYARDLCFEDRPGSITDINTTPIDLRAIPPDQKTDGLRAGNISLYIESYDGGLNGRFIMNGTKGYYGGQPGDDGVLSCTLDTAQPLAWLSPYSLKMVVAHARDAYLYRYTAETHDILSEYAGLLNIYRALPEYNDVPERWQFEFEQLHQEVITILHQLENGLDYFGNPPDWVPALSFEVLYTVYKQEIDHAIRVMYLSYWLQNKADKISKKAAALSNYRSQLWEDTVQARDNYNIVKELIGPLKARANSIAARIGTADGECYGLLCNLKNKEEELLERAKRNVQEAHKVPEWKTALNAIGVIGTSTINAGQVGSTAGPEGAAVGVLAGYAVGTISVFTDESIMNPNPWPKASMRTDVAKQFNRINFDQATEGWMDDFNDIKSLSDIEVNGVDYMRNLRDNAADIADGMWDVKEALKTTLLDDEEVEAELKEIKATDPTFNSLVDEVTELMVEKQIFNRQLAAAMQKVASLSNLMTNNILAIDAMNRDASHLNRIVDPRAVMYVRDMESRALARLRRYHYYLGKAYEYRLLEPYKGDLGIDEMFEKIKKIAAAPNDPETVDGYLGPQDFDALKVIYEEELKQLTKDIVDLFLSGRIEKNVPTFFEIYDQQELRQINSGEPLTVNLLEMGLFPSDKENIRIVDMNVADMNVSLTGDCNGHGQIAVTMQHPAVSKLQYFQQLTPGTENIYQFRHLAEDTKDLLDIKWESYYDIVTGQLTYSQLSASQESLLWSLLGEDYQEHALIYSRPGAWADITITKRDNLPRPKPDCQPCRGDIEYLLLEVSYDYYDKKTALQTLRVTTWPIIPPWLSVYELMPYFLVDTPDKCGRQDGIGNFYRIYNWYLVPQVKVTAPTTYGNWRFDKWTDKNYDTLGYEPTLEFTFQPEPNDNPTVWAEYVYEGPIPSIADFDLDYDVDFEDYAALSSVWLTGPADPKWDPMYDISDPPDNYIDWRDVAVLCEDWLTFPQ